MSAETFPPCTCAPLPGDSEDMHGRPLMDRAACAQHDPAWTTTPETDAGYRTRILADAPWKQMRMCDPGPQPEPPELRAHRPSAFAWIRCAGDRADARFVAVTRRYGTELNAPGGKIEHRRERGITSFESPMGAAIRETFEETEILLKPEDGIHLCTIGYAHMFLWDFDTDPQLGEPERGIQVRIVPERELTHSQYFPLFNGPCLDIVRGIPRSQAGRSGYVWAFQHAGPLSREDCAEMAYAFSRGSYAFGTEPGIAARDWLFADFDTGAKAALYARQRLQQIGAAEPR